MSYTTASPELVLDVKGLEGGYGQIQVLHGLDFHVADGEIVIILGANGAGKTTTLRAIMGLVRPAGGAIRLDVEAGLRVAGWSTDDTLVEVIEVPDHPWFVACQFHPEFTSTPRDGHPLFTGFIEAALKSQQGELPAVVSSL